MVDVLEVKNDVILVDEGSSQVTLCLLLAIELVVQNYPPK